MSPIETIDHFYQAIKDKRVEDICKGYVPSCNTYVILEGPRHTTLGFEKISRGWGDFCNSTLTLNKIKWVGGMVVLNVKVKGKEFTVQFRSTFALRKNEEHIR